MLSRPGVASTLSIVRRAASAAVDAAAGRSTLIKWLIGLGAVVAIAAVAALAWLPRAPEGEMISSTRIASVPAGLPPVAEPDKRESGPLSVAELRWCLTEQVRLEAIQPRLETRPAADRYNELAEDFNRRCGGRSASNERQEEVAAAIAASRESIEAAAIEEVRTLNDAVPFSTTEAQELLSMLGYDPGVVDGVFSEQTRAAIKAFQKRNGGPMDGLLSRELFDQLGRALARYRIQSERCRVRSSESQQQRADFRC